MEDATLRPYVAPRSHRQSLTELLRHGVLEVADNPMHAYCWARDEEDSVVNDPRTAARAQPLWPWTTGALLCSFLIGIAEPPLVAIAFVVLGSVGLFRYFRGDPHAGRRLLAISTGLLLWLVYVAIVVLVYHN